MLIGLKKPHLWKNRQFSREVFQKSEISSVAVNEMTTVEITKMAMQVQDQTQESTSRTKRLVQETIEVSDFIAT